MIIPIIEIHNIIKNYIFININYLLIRSMRAEENALAAEEALREERRKSARLQQVLERVQLDLRKPNNNNTGGQQLSSSQSSQSFLKIDTNASDDLKVRKISLWNITL